MTLQQLIDKLIDARNYTHRDARVNVLMNDDDISQRKCFDIVDVHDDDDDVFIMIDRATT